MRCCWQQLQRWKVLVEQTDAMDKLQGEHLQQMAVVQQMVVDQREAMGSMGEAPDFATILADQMAHVGRNLWELAPATEAAAAQSPELVICIAREFQCAWE